MTSFVDGADVDREACVALWVAALTARDCAPPPDGTAERARGKLSLPPVVWLVARGASGIEGFSLVTGAGTGRADDPADGAYLSLLAVAPGAQGRGLGGRLLAETHRRLADAGVSQAVLHVMTSNTAAWRLYESAGWSDTGVREPHALSGAETATLELRL